MQYTSNNSWYVYMTTIETMYMTTYTSKHNMLNQTNQFESSSRIILHRDTGVDDPEQAMPVQKAAYLQVPTLAKEGKDQMNKLVRAIFAKIHRISCGEQVSTLSYSLPGVDWGSWNDQAASKTAATTHETKSRKLHLVTTWTRTAANSC